MMESEENLTRDYLEYELRQALKNIPILVKQDFCLTEDNPILTIGGKEEEKEPQKQQVNMSVIHESIEELTPK